MTVEELIKAMAETHGLIGILLAAPVMGLVFVWKDNRRLERELQKANGQIVDAHRLRVEDAQKISEKLMQMISEQSSLNKETNLALERIGEVMGRCRH